MAAAESRHASDDADSTDLQASVFVSADAEVHEMPVSVIKRPLIPVVDEAKVQDFMDKIQVCTGGQRAPAVSCTRGVEQS